MRVRGLFVSMVVALIAVPVFAADPAAGKIEGWMQIAPGVSQRIEQGATHIRATGRDGLVWDISNQEVLLRETASRADLSTKERAERFNIITKRLIRLHAILDRMQAADEARTQAPGLCFPSQHYYEAQGTPFGGAFHGSFAKVTFIGTNCEDMYGDGYVYAYSWNSDGGLVEHEDSAFNSQSFDIMASATGGAIGEPHCDYAYAYLHWIDAESRNTYRSDTYTEPLGCY